LPPIENFMEPVDTAIALAAELAGSLETSDAQ